MMYNEKIEILLSTHNGGQYLSELIDSVLSQQVAAPFFISIFDDNSSDNSVSIIKRYLVKDKHQLKLTPSASIRLGAMKSFSRLLKMARGEYVMFCDQDDIWLPGKIEKTYKKMLWSEEQYGKETPILIHTDLKVVDSTLRILSNSFWAYQNIHPKKRESLNRLLLQNVVTGCTVMINSSLQKLASPIPSEATMHDWWLSLVASAFGKIEHLDEPTILYRQHNNNEIGAKRWRDLYSKFLKVFDDDRSYKSIANSQLQANAFLIKFSEYLRPEDFKLLADYTNINNFTKIKRIFRLVKNRFFKAGLLRNLGLIYYI